MSYEYPNNLDSKGFSDLALHNSLYSIEHFDSSSRALPTPGYRLREYHKIEQFADSRFPESSTHSRVGDWEVTRVEEYSSELPINNFQGIVICYCHYSPVTTSLEPLSEIQGTHELQEAV